MGRVEFKSKDDFCGETIQRGDIFIIDRTEVYMVVQANREMFSLINIEDGNRCVSQNIKDYTVERVRERILNFKQNVRYIPRKNIKITIEEEI